MQAHGLPLAWLGAVLAAAVLWAYWPGLAGGFLFDDYINLDALGRYGAIDDSAAFWRYVTSGTADPLGRPLSLLTFLLDARNWPAPSAPFLRTNLMLHLVNGALLTVLVATLERHLGTPPGRGRTIALLAAGIWLLHPFFVSTTLYIVQREAMLPATLALAGLATHAWALQRVTDGASAPPVYYAALGLLVLAIGLAALAKANGALLCLFAWVLSATVSARLVAALPVRLRAAHGVAVLLPSLILIGAVCRLATNLGEVPEGRDWTLGARLLAEGPILLDYLRGLFNPTAVPRGVFADSYPVAGVRAWPGAALAWAGILMAVAAAIVYRRRMPRLAAAVLFFFSGHLIESTLVPLEPYFEHRNYVPALLLFWPLAAGVVLAPAARWLRGMLAAGALALLLLTTHHRATEWGNPARAAAAWAASDHASPRAQAHWSSLLVAAGYPDHAVRWLLPQWRSRPLDLQITASLLEASCATRSTDRSVVAGVSRALGATRANRELAFDWLAHRLSPRGLSECPEVRVADLSAWVAALRNSPALKDPGQQPRLASLEGRLALLESKQSLALVRFNEAYRLERAPDLLLTQASILRSAGEPGLALEHLKRFNPLRPDPRQHAWGMPRVHAWVLHNQHYWEQEVAQLRASLIADMEHPAE